jgi:hypothetical protein
MTLGVVLLWGPERGLFLMSEYLGIREPVAARGAARVLLR